MKVPFLDYAVILIYILAFIAIGAVITKKKVKSAADYSTASRGMGLFTVVGSTVATCMGATIIFGNFQLVHRCRLTKEGLTVVDLFEHQLGQLIG